MYFTKSIYVQKFEKKKKNNCLNHTNALVIFHFCCDFLMCNTIHKYDTIEHKTIAFCMRKKNTIIKNYNFCDKLTYVL